LDQTLKVFERHYAMPTVASSFHFGVNGDNPRGAECVYYSSGVLLPLQVPWPITLLGLQAQFKVISSGNQVNGVMAHLWVPPGPTGENINLKSSVCSPLAPLLSWHGQVDCDWGFGVSIHTAALIVSGTHKLVLTAQYRMREIHA
jgi:hypothetical protein